MNSNLKQNNLITDFLTDNPINDFEIDYFGYKSVAKDVASTIIQLNPEFGYVISINGEWGSGKTSFLYYIEKYLTDKNIHSIFHELENEIIVFKFDPWLFSGHQDIITQFFYQLQVQTNLNKSKISKETLKILNKLFEYGSSLKTIPTLEAQGAGWGFTILQIIINKKIQQAVKSIFELRNEIKEKIKQFPHKIVIIIDDIDRLTPEEIKEIFRAIKAIGDFPNIVYLLSFDEEIVTSAINIGAIKDNESRLQLKRYGNKYLEKIINFSIPLPVIAEHHLRKYIEEIIFDNKFENTKKIYLNENDWIKQYNEGLFIFLKTPRSIIRLNNAILLLYPSLENEINVVDFISLEIIRQNYPEVYNWIRNNHWFFIKSNNLNDLYRDENGSSLYLLDKFYSLIHSIPIEHRDFLINILYALFPKIRTETHELNGKRLPYHHPNERELKICQNYDTFLKYFRFQLEPDQFSNSELIEIINNISNPENFVKLLYTFKSVLSREGSKLFNFFVNILPIIDKSVSSKSLENFIKACLMIKDDIYTNTEVSYTKSILSEELSTQIIRTIFKCCNLFNYNERLRILKSAFSEGVSFVLMSDIIIVLRQQNGDKEWGADRKLQESEILIKIEDIKELENIFVQRITQVSRSSYNLLEGPEVSSIIYVWNKIDHLSSDIRSLIDSFLKNETKILEIILKSREQNYYRPIMPYSLEPFIMEGEFREKVQKIYSQKMELLSEKQKNIIESFLNEKRMKRSSDIRG